ncbi:peptide chain release factor N(5)-glutamine methyltransferase [Lichenicola sp.]|uniref:peptide chain release factor N(5)-glutamine methyltransferase n=1 Tax=Lichenicola sp. TaxID=2804529 RepID=UPI003B004858
MIRQPGRRMVRDLLAEAEAVLVASGIGQPRREARLLLALSLGVDAVGLLAIGPAAEVEAAGFLALLHRRAARTPMAYLIGRQGFWTLDLAVSDATLIPRADTESLIEALLQARPDRNQVRRILDLGTGTGCLLLAALSEYSGAWGMGVDVSEAACRLARLNARDNRLDQRTAILCGDWAGAMRLPGSPDAGFDVVLSNPPYIPDADIAALMPEVALHEPVRALSGGDDGLAAYRQIMLVLQHQLAPGGLAVLEVGVGQAGDVEALGSDAGLVPLGVRRDLGGVERAVVLEAPL